MKLLFDENLSYRLEAALADIYPGSKHVRNASLLGAPPKVIWLRTGNSTVNETIALLRSQYIVIRHFAEDKAATFLPLAKP